MRYQVADVCFEVRCPQGVAAGEVQQRYGAFETKVQAMDLLVEVDADPTFRNPRVMARPYPGIDAHREGDRYVFEREDVSVTLETSSAPARARGRIRDARSALDTVLRASLSALLPRRGALLLHASGVVDAGRAFLFAGPSGAGKSTVAALTRAPVVLSDDIVAVALRAGAAEAHSVPFGGLSAPRTSPVRVPIEVLCLLEKGEEHVLEPIEPAEGLGALLRNVVHLPLRDPGTAEVLRIAEEITRTVPLRRLRFRRRDGFWSGLRRVGGSPLDAPLHLDRTPGGD